MNTKVSGPINLATLCTPAEVALAWLHGVALLQQGIDDTAHSGDAQLLVSNLREGLVGFDLLPALPPPGEDVPPPGELHTIDSLFTALRNIGVDLVTVAQTRANDEKPGTPTEAAPTFDPTPEQMLAIIAEQVGAKPNDYFGIATAIQHLRERAGVRERAGAEIITNTAKYGGDAA